MFTNFKQDISDYCLPEAFTYPFYYEPHPLCELATRELQQYLQNKLPGSLTATGRMFAVLVVKKQSGETGYLAAYSRKSKVLVQEEIFVPDVNSALPDNADYKTEIIRLIEQIQRLEQNDSWLMLQQEKLRQAQQADEEINQYRKKMTAERRVRQQSRAIAKQTLSMTEYKKQEYQLNMESISSKKGFKALKLQWKQRLSLLDESIQARKLEIDVLKEKRNALIAQRQARYHDSFYFLNSKGQGKTLNEIFYQGKIPKRAGECALPKLLNYAFQNNLKPLAFNQFWWGRAPKSEIRHHKHHYPCCRGRCKPVLAHMLQGIEIETNPLIEQQHAITKEIDILYEDKDMVVINKPAGLLSIPGEEIKDSVYERIRNLFPQATGSLIVHRLDMATSGLMVLALNKDAHKNIQQQFIHRNIKKRYIAMLDGVVEKEEGVIDLPIHVDHFDRPRQIVSNNGKEAYTKWRKIKQDSDKTTVYFYPETGRTHQLRIHAAHQCGLNTPIVGDVLYGNKAERLYLHAEFLELQHPVTGKIMQFECACDFDDRNQGAIRSRSSAKITGPE